MIRVFIHASKESSAKRSAERNGISLRVAEARVETKNRDRAMYYQRYTGKVWGNAANYDLCIDTSDITVEQAADLIIAYAKMKGYSI